MTDSRPPNRTLKPDTIAVASGRHPEEHFGFVNPPVFHGSTILHPSAKAFRDQSMRYTYASRGTPTHDALQTAIADLEGAAGCRLTSSGRTAILLALLSVLRAGDHLLVIDNAYQPTRFIVDGFLTRMGVEATYFDPLVGSGIADLMRDNTRAVFLEAPGSLTFEMPDVPAITGVARARGIHTMLDNTWASPLFFKPFDHGVDISIHAATKHIVGHSDAMLGAVTANQDAWPLVDDTFVMLRLGCGPDDAYLGHRGLRSMPVRLARHQENGIEIARWLQLRPEVARVLHPALETDPGHAIWKRDFTGACGLFGCVLKACDEAAVDAFVDAATLFGIGASWGGYESLLIPTDPAECRTATQWAPEGPCLRFHIGLEDTDDLKRDLDQAFAAMHAAGA